MSNRVTLGPIEYEDLEIIREWRMSPEVTNYMYTDPTITKQDQEKWFESLPKSRSSKHWMVRYKDVPTGIISLADIDFTSKHCSWGIYIGNKIYQHRGVGAFATYQLICHVFDELKLNKLVSMVLSYNEPAIHLNESFGFRRDGYFREHCFKNNQLIDMIVYSLTKSDWKKLKPYFETKFGDVYEKN